MIPPLERVHASCVAFQGQAVLFLGPSGVGKSSMALRLMAFGALLVADDQVEIWSEAGAPWVRAPKGLPSLIEARGLGLLKANLLPKARLVLAVDLAAPPSARLPAPQHRLIAGHKVTCLAGKCSGHLAAGLWQYLHMGRGE